MDWRRWIDGLSGAAFGRGVVLTRSRIGAAFAVAIATDVLQFVSGPIGWAFSDEILDVIALVATTRLLGFHPLLLPTFVLEFVPVSDMLPTWTGCVALLVAIRKRPSQSPAVDSEGTTIDVTPKSVV